MKRDDNRGGMATEANFDRFVRQYGGRRIDESFGPLTFENADYIFENEHVLVELKRIETEFGSTESFKAKHDIIMKSLMKQFGEFHVLTRTEEVKKTYDKKMFEMYRQIISRIVKKANRQLKQTKLELRLEDYHGGLLVVNRGLLDLNVTTVLALLGRVCSGSYTQVEAVIYLTDHPHGVEAPGANGPVRLWTQAYRETAFKPQFSEFVNSLGRAWFEFCAAEFGPPAEHREGPNIDFTGARPIRD